MQIYSNHHHTQTLSIQVFTLWENEDRNSFNNNNESFINLLGETVIGFFTDQCSENTPDFLQFYPPIRCGTGTSALKFYDTFCDLSAKLNIREF